MEAFDVFVEKKAIEVTFLLDNFQKRIEQIENMFFFSIHKDRDLYLKNLKKIYPILNELDYELLKCESLELNDKLDILEGIKVQVEHYDNILNQLRNHYELNESESLAS